MKWIVGLDLRPQTGSAIQYATRLCIEAGVDPGLAVQGVHVIEPEVLVEMTRHATVEQVEGAALNRARKVLEEAEVGEQLADPVVVSGRGVENVLEAATLLHGADALIVGRRGRSDEFTFVRLGGYARRLLRRLNVPVVVVPPDMVVDELGKGPVLCAVDLHDESLDALRFAQKMALWLGRDLMVAHFTPVPDQIGYGEFMPNNRWDEICDQLVEQGRQNLDAWLAEERVTGVKKLVSRGPVIPALLERAQQLDVPILVLGSRRMNLLRRAVMPSVSSEIAGAASVPVAVVAPPPPDV